MSSYCMENHTTVKNLILLAFPGSRELETFLSMVFLLLYIFMIVGNGLIITIIRVERRLQRPMYFFLANFSGMEICYTTVFMPTIITNLMTGYQSISVFGCMVQLYFFVSFGVAELFLLAIMAFDRYQAICNPLRYTTVMTTTFCFSLAVGCWVSGFIFNLPPSLLMPRLDLSGNNVINHFLCDGPALIKLSCSDTSLNDLVTFVLAVAVMLSSFMFTFCSYFLVIYTILKIPTSTGRAKTFSTCSSHLTAAAIYYGTLIFMYVRPQSIKAYDMNKIVSMFYTIILPVLNPLIYCLRNKEVKEAIRKMII
ncbi:hypothetical protein FKM82_005240 [Ascaphus truei]